MNFQYQTALNHLGNILSSPSITMRCHGLINFINECTSEDIKGCFPKIVDHIFGGISGFNGWGLRKVSKENYFRDYDSVFNFLKPTGPLFQLSYKLLDDSSLRFSYPLNLLPRKLERDIQSGYIPHYLINKIPKTVTAQMINPVTHLSLNAFEYIIFNFAQINLIHLTDAKNFLGGWGTAADSVYLALLDEYMEYFFPCNGSGVAPIEKTHFSSFPSQDQNILRNRIRSSEQQPRQLISPSPLEMNRPTLFKSSVFFEPMPGLNPPPEPTKVYHNQSETWRSEVLLQTFIELWINIDIPNKDNFSINCAYNLPSVDQVKAIRHVVRHMHYFINCVNGTALHPMEDIKKNLFPIFQKKLYIFLNFLFNKWPSDSSFRIVYETWITFIQPWRYSGEKARQTNKKAGTDILSEKTDKDRYYGFILDNILFYSNLTQIILARFSRGDYNSYRNALMLFRTTKILAADEKLKSIIVDIEKNLLISDINTNPYNNMTVNNTLYNSNYTGAVSTGGGGSLVYQGAYYSTDHCYSTIKIAQIKQIFREVESSDFIFKPLFSDENRSQVQFIIQTIKEARTLLYDSLAKEPNKCNSSSYWRDFKDWLGFGYNLRPIELNTMEEKKKTIFFLDSIRTNLCALFDIKFDPDMTANISIAPLKGYEVTSHGNLPSYSFMNSQSSLKDILRSKKCIYSKPIDINLPFQNPDELLIRNYENQTLVRMAAKLSNFLNHTFMPNLEQHYFERDFLGKFLRTILTHPQKFQHFEKLPNGKYSKSVIKYLPPRFNLRFLASNYFLSVLLFFGTLFYFLDFGSFNFIILIIGFSLSYIFAAVLTEKDEFLMDIYKEFHEHIHMDISQRDLLNASAGPDPARLEPLRNTDSLSTAPNFTDIN